ncbi:MULTISPECIES: HAD hydrolase-like protein [unclassified Paenibacillus]|uniref:HAD hydrolase-like protein n=1 Tax=unclassified Paenibacillus TaxID=185978 RepID=UPI0024BACBDE|nr:MULTISPECIES: HAD hydrolase-like protein [unclassified Paenibacillus]
MIQAVIFNLESTLLDPGGRGLIQGIRDIFRWKGVQVTEEQASYGRGLPIRDHIANVLALSEVRKKWLDCFGTHPGRTDIEHIYLELVPVLRSLIQGAEPTFGIDKALNELQDRRIQSGATASCPMEMLGNVFTPAQSPYALDCTVAPCEVSQGRPYPWMIYEIAHRLQVFPLSDIVKVGDTAADMQEGRNAGVWTIGVLNHSEGALTTSQATSRESDDRVAEERRRQSVYGLKRAGAHIVMNSVADLPRILREIEMLQHTGGYPSYTKQVKTALMPPS